MVNKDRRNNTPGPGVIGAYEKSSVSQHFYD